MKLVRGNYREGGRLGVGRCKKQQIYKENGIQNKDRGNLRGGVELEKGRRLWVGPGLSSFVVQIIRIGGVEEAMLQAR